MNTNTTRVIAKPNGSVINAIKKAIADKKEANRKFIESIDPKFIERLTQLNKVDR